MDCNRVEELLVDYIYQELDGSEMERMEAHLQGCPRCSRELSAFEDTRGLMRELPEEEPPPEISALLLREASRVAESASPSIWERLRALLRGTAMHPAMTAAMTLVLVLGVSFMVYKRGPETSDSAVGDLPLVQDESAERATISPSGGAPPAAEGAPMTPQAPEVTSHSPRADDEPPPAPVAKAEEKLADHVRREVPLSQQAPVNQQPMEESEELAGLTGKKGGAGTSEGRASADSESAPSQKNKGFWQDKELQGQQATRGRARAVQGPVGIRESQPTRPQLAKRAGKSALDVNAAPRDKADAPAAEPSAKRRNVQNEQSVDDLKGGDAVAAPASRPAGSTVATGAEASRSKQRVASARKAPPAKGTAPAKDEDDAGTGPAAALLKRADQASAAGRCDAAFRDYDRALAQQPELAPVVAQRLRACSERLARQDEAPLLAAQKQYPRLASLLEPEVRRTRRARVARQEEADSRKAPPVQKESSKAQRKAAPAKAVDTAAY